LSGRAFAPTPASSACSSGSASPPTPPREGVNLQNHCADLFHFDVPWNPRRMEQRNGRIDRKLQRAEQVYCRYFVLPRRATRGIPIRQVQEWLGHGSILVTMRHAHRSPNLTVPSTHHEKPNPNLEGRSNFR
jgi:hypothetical protein